MGLTFANVPVTFTFPEQDDTPEEERATVTLRGVSLAKVREIQKTAVKKKVEYKSPKRGAPAQRFEYDEIDEDKLFAEVWDYCIVGWKNINDEDGSPLECSLPSKLALLNGSIYFLEKLTEWREKLEEELGDQETRAEGN